MLELLFIDNFGRCFDAEICTDECITVQFVAEIEFVYVEVELGLVGRGCLAKFKFLNKSQYVFHVEFWCITFFQIIVVIFTFFMKSDRLFLYQTISNIMLHFKIAITYFWVRIVIFGLCQSSLNAHLMYLVYNNSPAGTIDVILVTNYAVYLNVIHLYKDNIFY